jgi:hypothetical protein
MTFSICIRTVPSRETIFRSLLAELSVTLSLPQVLGIHVSACPDVAPNENGCRALASAASDDADWVLFLEDDAWPITDLIGSAERWLLDFAEDDIHIYALGSPLGVDDVPAVRWPLDQFYCSVAMAIRGSMVRSLVGYLRENGHVRTGFDLMSANWHRVVSESDCLLAAAPSMVDHLGVESTLIDTRPHRNVVPKFTNFRGEGYTYPGRHSG